MGRFHYNNHTKVEIEDRALAHIQMVIGNKLKRGESFFFTWREDASVGDGRNSVWVHPGGDISFRYFGSRSPSHNKEWLEALAYTANSNRGLYLVPSLSPPPPTLSLPNRTCFSPPMPQLRSPVHRPASTTLGPHE